MLKTVNSNGCGIVRSVVSDALYFPFEKGLLMFDDNSAIIPSLWLEYYEAKILILSLFSRKPDLEMPR